MDTQITRQELTKKMISIISRSLRLEEVKIQPGSGIITDLNADSLDILEMRYSIEQEFGIKIDGHELADRFSCRSASSEIEQKFSVSDLVDFTEEKIKEQTSIIVTDEIKDKDSSPDEKEKELKSGFLNERLLARE